MWSTHTLLYSKSVSQIKPLLSVEETCLLEIRLRGGDLLLFACCYRSPTPSETSNQNNDKLNRFLRCIEKKHYSHWCIAGNFNFRDINWSTWTTLCSENSIGTSFIEAVRDSYLSRKRPVDVGTTIRPCLILYSLMKQCKSQIFNITHH